MTSAIKHVVKKWQILLHFFKEENMSAAVAYKGNDIIQVLSNGAVFFLDVSRLIYRIQFCYLNITYVIFLHTN